MADTRAVAKKWFESLDKADYETAMACLADDVEWVNIAPVEHVSDVIPWIGTAHGIKQVMEAFASRDAHIDLEKFETTGVVIGEGQACGTINEISVVKATGQRFEISFATWLHIDNGKIVRWQSFCDPSPIIAAFRGDVSKSIIAAVARDDVEAAADLLKTGADPNTRDPNTGLTLLMTAACHANLAVTKLLVTSGADVFTADTKTGATALHKACQGGNLEVVRLLLDEGAHIDAVTPTMGHTPLMDALWYKWVDVVELLIERGANLQFGTHYGFSMDDHIKFELNVNQGEEKEKFRQIADLIETRRGLNQRQIAEQSVMAATVKGDLAAVRQAISKGATVNTVHPHINSFQDGHTPLLVAARDGHTQIVRELLDNGAEVRVQDWVFKGAPIHKATYNGNLEILKMLIESPDIDLDVQGPINGYTPLHDALWHGFGECAEVLVDAKASLELLGHDGKTVLDLSREVLGPEHRVTKIIEAKMSGGAA